jgi:hypothetical protein
VIDDKLFSRGLLKELDLAQVKVERVDPFQDDIRQNLSNTFLSESKIFTTYNRRVDKEKTDTIGSILVDNVERVWVVFQTLAHFLSIAEVNNVCVDRIVLTQQGRDL